MKLIEATASGFTLYEMPEYTYCLLMRHYFSYPRQRTQDSRIRRMIVLLPEEQRKRITITENYQPKQQLRVGHILIDEAANAID